MIDLAQQRCLTHAAREAVARCPGCAQFFCRECVTEHDDRLLCAGCLKKLAKPTLAQRWRLASAARAGQCVVGLVVAWLFFYCVGLGLASMKSSFHEGTVWKVNPFDEP